MTEPDPAPVDVLCTPWTTPEDVLASPKVPDTVDPTLLQQAVDLAGQVLYVLSGSRWRGGGCTATVQSPALPGRSACCGGSEYELGLFPVTEVTAVRVDGVALAEGTWEVRSRRVLHLPGVRSENPYATNCLPGVPDHLRGCCPREVVADVVYGAGPPQAGRVAAAALAAELILAWTKSASCSLPARVTTVTRQNTTAVVLDPLDFLDKGKVGVYAVDLFLTTYNPTRRRRRASVWSPDVQHARVL